MLEGRVALVTGGSGAVGRAIVRALAQESASVAFTYLHNQDRAQQLQEELGDRVRAYRLDVTDGQAATALAEQIQQELGPLEILVNNAGCSQVMPFALIEPEDWDWMMQVNVKGMFLVTKAMIRGMIRRKKGNVINIGSLAGTRLLEVPVHYATAKSAVMGFTLSLAREMARYSIRVNAVIPGMLSEGVASNVPEKQREEYCRYCTQSRPGEPEEVAQLVAFLAGDKSSYINAQAIHVDGGI
jgi:NAD(P)-dependent dehydrogenase (short-subunit alcohol dehydrogenase family)